MAYEDLLGIVAATLVLSTFCMRTMLWLRLIGVLSNVAFISYGLELSLYPIVTLHVALLAINTIELLRLWAKRRQDSQRATVVAAE